MKTSLNKNKKVFVGVSGGVDSSVSLALLKEQGYNVVGVFIRTWQPDFIECTWRAERRDAMRVCAKLDVPFLECDAVSAYKNEVAMYMIQEYQKGNTPNPDVMCNRKVKFGVFLEFAKKHDADFIATGHYATTSDQKLYASPDKSKDQSYFLWSLTKDDLTHTLFPIGHLHKNEVRKLAEKYDIPVANKKDSQGVCFLGLLDMKDFLKHFIQSYNGDVLDEKGEIIGFHDGALFLTFGQRHGFTITNQDFQSVPMYVVAKDVKLNTITVSSKKEKSIFEKNEYEISDTNWISEIPDSDFVYKVCVRYHGEFLKARIVIGDKTLVVFEEPVLISVGQSIVVYKNNMCLGGGVVV